MDGRMRAAVAIFSAAVVLSTMAASAGASKVSPTHVPGSPFRSSRSRTIRLPRWTTRAETDRDRCSLSGGGSRYPLLVFGHGFALTPARYAHLLHAWTEAGYVVAAPVFPLGNADAPGGPNESDIINQPQDMSFVISKLLALSASGHGVLHGKIDRAASQWRGIRTAQRPRSRSPTTIGFVTGAFGAAVVLSGAALPGMGPFPQSGPPLLAVQGTADTTNAPATTAGFFRLARPPKFLLWLLRASHLPPYTDEQPQLGIVEQATTAFLDHYLKGRPLRAFVQAARRPGLTELTAAP